MLNLSGVTVMILLCPIHNGLWLIDYTLWTSSQLTTSSIHWPSYGPVHVYIVLFFENVCFFFLFFSMETNLCWFFFVLFAYICIAVGDPNIKRETDGTPLTSLPTPHICVCPNPGSELSSSNVVVCVVFND
jgi:hypothetical protein